MASNKWVADRVMDLLRDDLTMRPKELQDVIKKMYKLEVSYNRVFRGKQRALDMTNGKWDDSCDSLPTYQAELLRPIPSSVVELDRKLDMVHLEFEESYWISYRFGDQYGCGKRA